MTASARRTDSTTLPTLVGQAPVEPLDELDGAEIAHLVASVGGGVAERDQYVACLCRAAPPRQGFSFALTHSKLAK